MMPNKTTSLVFAAACLTAIAAISAHAQPASTYGATPGYTTPPSAAAYGATPGYTTPRGSAAYGATPGQQPYTPQASPGDVPQSAAARQNVIESRQYDRELETNRVPPGAHAQRMRPNFRSRTASKLPCELSSGRAFCGLIKLEPSSSQRVRPIKDPKSEIGSALRADPSP